MTGRLDALVDLVRSSTESTGADPAAVLDGAGAALLGATAERDTWRLVLTEPAGLVLAAAESAPLLGADLASRYGAVADLVALRPDAREADLRAAWSAAPAPRPRKTGVCASPAAEDAAVVAGGVLGVAAFAGGATALLSTADSAAGATNGRRAAPPPISVLEAVGRLEGVVWSLRVLLEEGRRFVVGGTSGNEQVYDALVTTAALHVVLGTAFGPVAEVEGWLRAHDVPPPAASALLSRARGALAAVPLSAGVHTVAA